MAVKLPESSVSVLVGLSDAAGFPLAPVVPPEEWTCLPQVWPREEGVEWDFTTWSPSPI